MDAILRTVQLSKCFGKTLVLDRVNLTLASESVYALLGANGAGKSTTVQILLNLLQPTSGHAEVFGHDSRRLSAKDFTQIGYVAEGQDLPDWMTVGRFMQYLKPFYPEWDDSLAENLLLDFSLPLDRKLGHLSRGMRMKVALTAALAYRPRLLLMDEPLSALDPLTRDELIEGLLANMQGASILICSHDLAEVETFASHIGYLENGRCNFLNRSVVFQSASEKWKSRLVRSQPMANASGPHTGSTPNILDLWFGLSICNFSASEPQMRSSACSRT